MVKHALGQFHIVRKPARDGFPDVREARTKQPVFNIIVTMAIINLIYINNNNITMAFINLI